MLHSKKLPLTLWGEAVNTAVYILNRTTSTRTPGTITYLYYVYKRKVIEFWKLRKKYKLKFATVQVRFKRVTSKKQLYR